MVRLRRALSISVSTLPLFARAHSRAAANGESSELRFAWRARSRRGSSAPARRARRAPRPRSSGPSTRAALLPPRAQGPRARAPKGPKRPESPRKKNAEATDEEVDYHLRPHGF